MSEVGPEDEVAGAVAAGGLPEGDIASRFANRVVMSVPDRHNEKLKKVIELVNADDDLYGLWTAANVNAVERLNMTDHGPVHVKIVMNIAVRMLRLLIDAGVSPSIVTNYGMAAHDAEVIVALAALLHDVGMSIHRTDHEAFSLFIAEGKLREILPELYPSEVRAIVRSEVLHAIISHRSGGTPLTLEAGCARHGEGEVPYPLRGRVVVDSLRLCCRRRVRLHRRRRGEADSHYHRALQLGWPLPARSASSQQAGGKRP